MSKTKPIAAIFDLRNAVLPENFLWAQTPRRANEGQEDLSGIRLSSLSQTKPHRLSDSPRNQAEARPFLVHYSLKRISRRTASVFLLLAASLSLSACNAFDRVMEIGEQPKLSSIENPTHAPGYTPVSMPMPAPSLGQQQPNSLWQTGARAFFRDQRASRTGDILTVIVTINDQAQLQNETKRSRDNTDTANMNNLLGLESKLSQILPSAVNKASLIDMGSTTSNDGKGSVARQEQINLRIAATITQVLPNGNLVLHGKQEVGVNYDMRELVISGVIRPQDIASDNTITYDKIAEARVEYGGRGTIADVQQPRYGEQLLDILMPF